VAARPLTDVVPQRPAAMRLIEGLAGNPCLSLPSQQSLAASAFDGVLNARTQANLRGHLSEALKPTRLGGK